MESRDKLILVHYIDTGNMDMSDIPGFIQEIARKMSSEKDEHISYFVPIRGETRIECINPKLVDENEFQFHLERLNRAKEEFERVIKEFNYGNKFI
jgi:hypothetical protein